MILNPVDSKMTRPHLADWETHRADVNNLVDASTQTAIAMINNTDNATHRAGQGLSVPVPFLMHTGPAEYDVMRVGNISGLPMTNDFTRQRFNTQNLPFMQVGAIRDRIIDIAEEAISANAGGARGGNPHDLSGGLSTNPDRAGTPMLQLERAVWLSGAQDQTLAAIRGRGVDARNTSYGILEMMERISSNIVAAKETQLDQEQSDNRDISAGGGWLRRLATLRPSFTPTLVSTRLGRAEFKHRRLTRNMERAQERIQSQIRALKGQKSTRLREITGRIEAIQQQANAHDDIIRANNQQEIIQHILADPDTFIGGAHTITTRDGAVIDLSDGNVLNDWFGSRSRVDIIDALRYGDQFGGHNHAEYHLGDASRSSYESQNRAGVLANCQDRNTRFNEAIAEQKSAPENEGAFDVLLHVLGSQEFLGHRPAKKVPKINDAFVNRLIKDINGIIPDSYFPENRVGANNRLTPEERFTYICEYFGGQDEDGLEARRTTSQERLERIPTKIRCEILAWLRDRRDTTVEEHYQQEERDGSGIWGRREMMRRTQQALELAQHINTTHLSDPAALEAAILNPNATEFNEIRSDIEALAELHQMYGLGGPATPENRRSNANAILNGNIDLGFPRQEELRMLDSWGSIQTLCEQLGPRLAEWIAARNPGSGESRDGEGAIHQYHRAQGQTNVTVRIDGVSETFDTEAEALQAQIESLISRMEGALEPNETVLNALVQHLDRLRQERQQFLSEEAGQSQFEQSFLALKENLEGQIGLYHDRIVKVTALANEQNQEAAQALASVRSSCENTIQDIESRIIPEGLSAIEETHRTILESFEGERQEADENVRQAEENLRRAADAFEPDHNGETFDQTEVGMRLAEAVTQAEQALEQAEQRLQAAQTAAQEEAERFEARQRAEIERNRAFMDSLPENPEATEAESMFLSYATHLQAGQNAIQELLTAHVQGHDARRDELEQRITTRIDGTLERIQQLVAGQGGWRPEEGESALITQIGEEISDLRARLNTLRTGAQLPAPAVRLPNNRILRDNELSDHVDNIDEIVDAEYSQDSIEVRGVNFRIAEELHFGVDGGKGLGNKIRDDFLKYHNRTWKDQWKPWMENMLPGRCVSFSYQDVTHTHQLDALSAADPIQLKNLQVVARDGSDILLRGWELEPQEPTSTNEDPEPRKKEVIVLISDRKPKDHPAKKAKGKITVWNAENTDSEHLTVQNYLARKDGRSRFGVFWNGSLQTASPETEEVEQPEETEERWRFWRWGPKNEKDRIQPTENQEETAGEDQERPRGLERFYAPWVNTNPKRSGEEPGGNTEETETGELPPGLLNFPVFREIQDDPELVERALELYQNCQQEYTSRMRGIVPSDYPLQFSTSELMGGLINQFYIDLRARNAQDFWNRETRATYPEKIVRIAIGEEVWSQTKKYRNADGETVRNIEVGPTVDPSETAIRTTNEHAAEIQRILNSVDRPNPDDLRLLGGILHPSNTEFVNFFRAIFHGESPAPLTPVS